MLDLTLDKDGIEDKETIGGGGNSRIWESGVYDTIIEMVTIEESSGGATAVNVTLKSTDKDSKLFPIRDTFWITSGEAKGQKTFYVDIAGKKHPLPGYTSANRLCIATEGKTLTEVVPTGEKKTINAYSWEAKKEIPVEKYVLTSLIGKPVQIAVQLFKRNRQKPNASGVYEDTAEVFESNEIRYFANAETKLSVGEMADGVAEAKFMSEWDAKNKGTTIDKTNKNLQPAATAATSAKASVFA